mmetsp:Transcript_1866/g.3737  ORF Transcript_1866/g.3737 Transcript_1866/m.3737 type:complete len:93 (+) Transcript_1866:219-497(+)
MVEREQVDDVGKIDIPDNKSFYTVLTTSSINILTSRRNQITKTQTVIDLRGLNKISRVISKQGDIVFKGGLEVLGQFDEGKCFKLTSRNGSA